MSRHTTFRIGGPANLLVDVGSRDELLCVLRHVQEHGLALHVIGRGANLLVSDAGVRGVVLRLAGDFKQASWDEKRNIAKVGAGVALATLVTDSARRGYDSFCWAVGIPGTIGGAVCCNAGAWGHAMGKFVEAVHVMTPGGEEKVLAKDEVTFEYRRSSIGSSDIILDATVKLERAADGTRETVDVIAENLRRKRETQPLDLPSAGSIFKNPPECPAGQLIDHAGCKGMREGDAVVSPKHANFIVNEGKATATDVMRLIERVRERVKGQFGVELELEIGIV
jgi:UDP-N-acetylmuramate dehydrogenase